MVTFLPETLHPLCRVYKRPEWGKKLEERTRMGTKRTSEDLPRVVKAGTRLWSCISALLAPPDTKPPGLKSKVHQWCLAQMCPHIDFYNQQNFHWARTDRNQGRVGFLLDTEHHRDEEQYCSLLFYLPSSPPAVF